MEEKEEEEEEKEENFRIPKEAAKLVESFGLEVGTFIQFLHLHTACMYIQCETCEGGIFPQISPPSGLPLWV